MAKLQIDTIAKAVYEASKDASPSVRTQINENVIKLLTRNRLMKEHKKLLNKIQALEDEAEGIMRAVVKSSRPLGEKSIADIVHFLKHYYNKTHVELEEKIDESLIAGIHLSTKDEVLDLTLSNRIHQLQTQLLKN